MAMKIVFLLLFIIGGFRANGTETWSIPQLDENSVVPSVFQKSNLPVPIQVKHPLFQVTVPKGWSIGIGKDDQLKSEIVILGPGPVENLRNEAGISLNIVRSWKPATWTVPAMLEARKSKSPSAKIHVAQGQEWVSWEDNQDRGEVKHQQWLLSTVKSGRTWLIMMNYPIAERSKWRPQLEGILSSLTLK